MRILNNLIVSGLVKSDGFLFVPEFESEARVSMSWASRSVHLGSGSMSLNPIAIYKDEWGIPKVLDTSSFYIDTGSSSTGSQWDGPTPLECEATNSIEISGSTVPFYKCIASASRQSPDVILPISNFSLIGRSSDSGGEYAGLERRNYSVIDDGSPIGRVTHESKIRIASGSSSGSLVTDFILDLVPKGNSRDYMPASSLIIYKCGVNGNDPVAIKAIADRFKAIMCKCLKNGQFISLHLRVICPETGKQTSQGIITYKKCFGRCKVDANYETTTGGIPRIPDIKQDGKAYGVATGYEFEFANSSFDYIISSVTGSDPIDSGSSGTLTASFTPFMTVPSAQTTPTTFYPFDGALTGSYLQITPGLIYFDSLNSTLNLYNGSGSWASFTAATGSISKYTTAIGNDSSTKFTVAHNKGTRDVVVTVRETAAPYEIVYPTVTAVTTNTIEVDFGVEVPTSNQYTVIVI